MHFQKLDMNLKERLLGPGSHMFKTGILQHQIIIKDAIKSKTKFLFLFYCFSSLFSSGNVRNSL